MAPITYYYIISIILATTPLLWLINLIYLRRRGRTTFGQVYVIGMPEYKRALKLASKRNVTITIVVELLSLANLIWSIWIVWRLNTPSAYFVLAAMPVAVASAGFFGVIKVRKEYGTSNLNKSKREKEGDKGGLWIS